MSTPQLIQEQRQIARSLQASLRQQFHLLDGLRSAQRQQTAAAEQVWLDTTTQNDELLGKFIELEHTARAKARNMDFDIFNKIEASPSQPIVEIAPTTLSACVTEIEQFLEKFANVEVVLIFADVPAAVDKEAVVRALNSMMAKVWKTCPRTGEKLPCSLDLANKVIQEMATHGVTAEIAA